MAFFPSMQNAWTNEDVDTRNVVGHEFIVEVSLYTNTSTDLLEILLEIVTVFEQVKDEQDTLPYFLSAPPVTVLPETAKEVRKLL